MAFYTESSSTPAARCADLAALGRAVNDAGNDARAQGSFTLASLSSSSLPPCPRPIGRVPGPPGPDEPSSRSHNAHSRGDSGIVGARLRYGTDPMPLRSSLQLTYAAPTAAGALPVLCAAPRCSDGSADQRQKDCISCIEGADRKPHGTTTPPADLQPLLSPTGAPAAARKGAQSGLVLLRHSHGIRTRLLYADGHIETIVGKSATKLPAERSHTSSAARRCRRRCVDDNGIPTPTLQLGAAARDRADTRSLTSVNEQCLLKSFAVAQTHQQAPPQLEPLTLQWTGVDSFRSFPSHAAESGVARSMGSKPTPQSSVMGPTFPLPSQERRSLPSGDFNDDRSRGERDRKHCETQNDGIGSGRTAAFSASAAEPPALATTASTSRRGDDEKKSFAAVATAAAAMSPHWASSVDETTSREAVDGTRTVVVAMQRCVRAELAAEHRAGEQIFADRYARDVSASPSLFSLCFPFRPLSELYAFADRPDSDRVAPVWWRCAPNGNQARPSTTGHQRALSSAGGVGRAAENPRECARPQPQTAEVLLPHAQITTPSGFTVPELLQERLLPRETPALQHKLSELRAVHGLVDVRDSTACRFTVSFIWFVILRCRKAHREQSLVDDFRRLSRALSYAFPHVTLDDVLPPLDVLEQLLVELLTCSRYSKEMQNTADTETSAAAAANAASTVSASRRVDEPHTASSVSIRNRASGGAASGADQQGGGSQPSQVSRSAIRNASRTPTEVKAATAPSRMPLRLQLHEHKAFFPLLLSPLWSRLIRTCATDPGSSGVYEESATRYTQQQQLLHHPNRQEEQGVLPSADALDILCKVYQDLWLHHSEYVQLCLYEELLYKQLALHFGTFTMHLHQGAMSAEAAVAAATPASLSAGVSKGSQPSMPSSSSTGADASRNLGGEGASDLCGSRSGMPAPGGDLQASMSTTIASVKTTTAAATTATPVVADSVLDSLLLLVAHATYFNCVFCFPNDVYAGMFDEDFRADVMRWLFFCCHGVVLTHVQVRRWPAPVKSDYIDAQQKRKAAVELQLSALGLLPTHAQQPIVASHAAISSRARGQVSSTAIADNWERASLVMTPEDGTLDAAGVAANSEARLAYQFDRYGRYAALHVAELERCMARLQRRHMRSGSYSSHTTHHRTHSGSGSGRIFGNSRPSSAGSVRGTPSSWLTHPNLSDMEMATLTSQQRVHSPPVSPLTDSPRAAACTQAEATRWLQQKCTSAAPRAKLPAAEAGTLSRTSIGEFTIAASESPTHLPAVDAHRRGSRSGPKQVAFIQSSAEPSVPRPRRIPAFATVGVQHHDREEETRAQLRTSTTATVGKNLVALAAELRSAGRKGAVGRVPWKASSAPAVREVSSHGASASPCKAKCHSGHFGGSAVARDGSVREVESLDRDCGDQEIEGQGQPRESSTGSLLSAYPLCVCPPPVRDYWLSTLLRTPLWWTVRTAPATPKQQSTKLVLWPSVPIGADGEVMLQRDLCRLQLEPWQALFSIVVVPPISKDAQQAAHRIRAYGKVMPQQQACLYRMMELQKLHHQQDRQRCSQEDSGNLPALALAPPTSAVNAMKMSALPIEHAFSAVGTAEMNKCTASDGAFANVLSWSSALLPLVPLSIPGNGAALVAPATTSMPAATSAPTDLRLGRRGIGEVYEGCTSPFFKLCSSYFIPAASGPSFSLVHSRSGEHARRQTRPQQLHRSVVGRSNGYPDPAEATMLTMTATSVPSIMWGMTPESTSALPALEHLYRCAPADQGPIPFSTAAVTTYASNGPTSSSQLSAMDMSSRGGCPRSRGGSNRVGSVRSTYTRKKAKQRSSIFAITAIPREEAKLRPRSLGPLKKEALRRRAQLLADMDTIGRRDRVARQHYIVQHLKLCNAMTYTQSEAMMRRYRTQSRLALERLRCGDVGDGAAARAMAEGARDVSL